MGRIVTPLNNVYTFCFAAVYRMVECVVLPSLLQKKKNKKTKTKTKKKKKKKKIEKEIRKVENEKSRK